VKAMAKVGGVREAHDCVPVALFRHVVNQVHQAVFQAAQRQPVDDVQDKRRPLSVEAPIG